MAIVIVAILICMSVPLFSGILAKAERVSCSNNLRGLYLAAVHYLEDHDQHWPQVPTKDIQSQAYAHGWVDTFGPYGISHKGWICPSIQRLMHGADYEKSKSYRIDYFGCAFADKPLLPYKWKRQPWFVERANVHGEGQLVIFSNSEMKPAQEIFTESGTIQDF